MHSKVIIASLACVMAASFANGRVSNASVAKAPQLKAEETSCCNAPNEGEIIPALYADTPYQNNDFCVFLQGLEYQSELADHLGVIRRSSSSLNVWTGYNPAYGHYFDVSQPSTDGDYYVTMGSMGRELATLYICRKNGISYGSVYSKNDAREKCYFGTNSSAYIVRQAATQFQASTSAFSAVKEYCSYVYGTDDITTGMNVVSRPSGETNDGTTLKFRVVWQADGKTYPAKNIPFHIAVRGSEVSPSVGKKTNSSGEYSIKLSSSMTSGLKLNEIGYAMSTDTAVTEVLSNSDMNYPYYGKYTLSWSVSSYKTINFNITIYPSRSDRAAAYEITQAHQLLGGYAKDYTKRTLSKIVTEYPARTTAYYSNGRGGCPLITVKKAHYHSWDALNHEFAHYICDDANLCYMPSEYEESKPHSYNENLANEYGNLKGAQIAYSEGLATFIVIAGQIKNAIYSTNAYVNTIAGYNYFDFVNGVNVDYSLAKYGEPYSAHGSAVEASVTNIMAKLMADNNSISEGQIWRAIINASYSGCTISQFADELIKLCPSASSEVYKILQSENITVTDNYESLSGLNTTDEWTIMLYMCASSDDIGHSLVDQACESLQAIYDVPNQPSNVNIIFYLGGNTVWPIDYHGDIPVDGRTGYYGSFENNELTVEALTTANMGSSSTLKDFINWGIDEYPAKKMGLVLFNHGNALNGCCFDSRRNDHLDNSEVSKALEDVYSENPNIKGKFEFIGYDACLMQLQDVAEFNSNYFNYMVASEEYTYGWDYSGFIQAIYNRSSTLTALNTLCDDFIPRNNSIYESHGEAKKACLSVLDLSKMKAYRNQFESLAVSIKNTVINHKTEFLNVISQSTHYANRVGNVVVAYNYEKYGTIDGYDFLTKLAASPAFSQYSSQINAVKSAYNSVVRTNVKALPSNQSYGLAIHVCLEEYPLQTYDINQTHFYNWRNLFVA